MKLKKWEYLPEYIKNDDVKNCYEILQKKKIQICLKRIFDVIIALILLIILSPAMLVIAIAIKLNSKGTVFFRQVRITQYGREFKIFKFRTMVTNAEKIGTQVTVESDPRITKVGSKIRKLRLDELPQLFNILLGDMSFVGTRPEVPKYVDKYSDEMKATLLLRAGVTSEASIKYKDEDLLLSTSKNVDETYMNDILPSKMTYNIESLKRFSFLGELKVMLKTVLEVLI